MVRADYIESLLHTSSVSCKPPSCAKVNGLMQYAGVRHVLQPACLLIPSHRMVATICMMLLSNSWMVMIMDALMLPPLHNQAGNSCCVHNAPLVESTNERVTDYDWSIAVHRSLSINQLLTCTGFMQANMICWARTK